MKKIDAYEFEDLRADIKKDVREKFINEEVEFALIGLESDMDKSRITEEQYYNELGCSKSYAESTSWFVPACYYEKHKEEIDQLVEENLNQTLFNNIGVIVGASGNI